MKKYKISLNGCDDSTKFEMSLNQHEYNLLKLVEKLSRETSGYPCQPVLIVEEIK